MAPFRLRILVSSVNSCISTRRYGFFDSYLLRLIMSPKFNVHVCCGRGHWLETTYTHSGTLAYMEFWSSSIFHISIYWMLFRVVTVVNALDDVRCTAIPNTCTSILYLVYILKLLTLTLSSRLIGFEST